MSEEKEEHIYFIYTRVPSSTLSRRNGEEDLIRKIQVSRFKSQERCGKRTGLTTGPLFRIVEIETAKTNLMRGNLSIAS